MAKIKELTLQEVVKNDKKLDEKKKVLLTLYDGSTYTISVDKFFRPSKIQKYIIEHASILEELKEKGINENLVSDVMLVEHMLLIRNFVPSLEVPLVVEEIVAYAMRLIELEIYDQILHAFEPNEISKIDRIGRKILENIPQLKSKMDQLYDQIAMDQAIPKHATEEK